MKLTPIAVCRTRASLRLRRGSVISVHSSASGPPVARTRMPRVMHHLPSGVAVSLAARPLPLRAGERAGGNDKVGDRSAGYQVLGDDPLEVLGRAVPVPGAFRIDDRDRAPAT